MKNYLGVDEYYRLPRHVRDQVDDWLRAEGLMPQYVRRLWLGEGTVKAECILRPTRLDWDGKIATEIRELPIRTMPPAAAFAD